MSLEAWALFCLTELVLCLNPGPSSLVVISQSLIHGSAAGVRATLGVIAANAIYFSISATGLVTLHSVSAEAFSIVKWCGAGYLVWLGVGLIRSSFRPSHAQEPAASRVGSSFWRGFVTQGANPALLIYFTAILPQFIDPGHAVAPQVALLACSSFIIESSVLAAYAGVSGRAAEAIAPRFHARIVRAGGALLIGAAAGLANLERE